MLLTLAAALVATSCRKPLVKPVDGVVSGGGGSGGKAMGGAGGNGAGGAGGSMIDARDMAAPPDVPPADVMEAPAEVAPACGLGGQPCCPGNVCTNALGNAGCCESGICTDHSTSCRLGDRGTCLEGACGGACVPQPPPLMGTCCGMTERNCSKPYSVCTGVGRGVCVNCGGPNEPCCADNYCKPGGTCANMVCTATSALVSPPDDEAAPTSADEPY